ncbi:type I methionyl aminopeptidase [bacterium]|nr:type I methionyl aminopeptidase [bacterium]
MITVKTEKEIEIMREGGQLLADILEEVSKKVAPGVTTKELDALAENLILRNKAKPAFKGYGGFPATLCTSVNNVVVHGVPSDRRLEEGDIISLDIGLVYKGFFADMAKTVAVGSVNPEAMRLIRVTKKALKLAIKKSKPGNTFGDIGNTIQRYVEYQGFGVVRDLCGHGIGTELHEEPEILNYGKRHSGPKIKEGMVFCIEPMVAMGDWHIKKSADKFGYETKDGSLSAHFEHMVAVKKDGPHILSLPTLTS